METKKINCSTHGIQNFGLLCLHLASGSENDTLGFWEQKEEDANPMAWCNKCEERWATTQSEENGEKWFEECDFKIICATCYLEIKEINKL